MKKKILTAAILISLSIGSLQMFAQPPNPNGVAHGETTSNQSAAPIGSGLALLIGMGAAYAGIRLYKNKEEK